MDPKGGYCTLGVTFNPQNKAARTWNPGSFVYQYEHNGHSKVGYFFP